ncbi:putative bifunctional diguanylate cyclase/phosphodiesterase [Gluconobacter morbifer]|uniref:Sensory box/GGDEF family protein n=1 Tax=Gluconobacter morbifer G707 TaxID=1088869 RepID=G6XFJ0_9PROT|nr:EAL domain-containing protein [Gluconobacter morbifer]EHH68948.1 hypothetical protein GMO_02550 [Gluconobacter morbifer G707]
MDRKDPEAGGSFGENSPAGHAGRRSVPEPGKTGFIAKMRRILRQGRLDRFLTATPRLRDAAIPHHLRCAFDLSRLEVLQILLPMHLLAQAVGVLVLGLALWPFSHCLAAVSFGGSEAGLLLWVLVARSRIRRLLDGTKRKPGFPSLPRAGTQCPDCPDQVGCTREKAPDFRSVWNWIRFLNAGMGLIWFGGLIIAFRMPCESIHLLVMAVVIGLLAPLLLCALVPGAVSAMGVPIILAVYGILIQGFPLRSLAVSLSFFLAATAWGFFLLAITRVLNVLLTRVLLDRIEQREHAEIVSLLTRRSDSHVGDWLWETDAKGVLCDPSARFCQMLGRPAGDVATFTLASVLSLPVIAPGWSLPAVRGRAMSAPTQLAYCLANQLPFRELAVPVQAGTQERWWLMTGHPVFRAGVFLGYRGVGADVTERQEQRQVHFERVRRDALTGLPNRLACAEYLQRHLLEKTRSGKALTLFRISVSPIRRIGGEPVMAAEEDIFLQETACRIRAFVKETGFAGCQKRYEFTVMLTEDTDRIPGQEGVIRLVEQLLHVLKEEVVRPDGTLLIGHAAIGVAIAQETAFRADHLLEAADLALHDARQERSVRYSVFDQLTEEQTRRQAKLFRHVRRACEERAFRLMYQPIINARTGRISGYEALCRWNGSVYGHLSPERVIAIIDRTDQAAEFDAWVLETACRDAAQWDDSLWVSVNIPAKRFSAPGIIPTVLDILERTGLSPRRLQIEVTETQALDIAPHVYDVFEALGSRGVCIALDDFGKGYSALSYLRLFPFSKVKLDAVFVQDMFQDARSAAAVRGAVEIAVDLGIGITAEGVCSPEHYRALRQQGCTELQGYFLGHPVSRSEVLATGSRTVHAAATLSC